MYTLAAFADKEWKGQTLVGLVEVASKIKPLWRAYERFTSELHGMPIAGFVAAAFNPFDLDTVRARQTLREQISSEIERRTQYVDGEAQISPQDITEALAIQPSNEAFSPEVCLFMQLADATGVGGGGRRRRPEAPNVQTGQRWVLDAQGRRRVVELQVKTLALRHPGSA